MPVTKQRVRHPNRRTSKLVTLGMVVILLLGSHTAKQQLNHTIPPAVTYGPLIASYTTHICDTAYRACNA
jgi:hypothetical protein